jgi:hypothetical protein
MHESPQKFYAAIETAIKQREIPDCRLRRVYWRQGGRWSAKREYLRAERGEYLIDICGAPFGNAFFASSWLCFPPPSLLTAICLIISGLLVGAFFGNVSMHVRKSVFSVLLGVDAAFIVGVLIFGIIRPLFFPPRPTYYRIDTADMFYQAVHQSVLDVIDGLRSAQGLRLLTEAERKPIMRGFGR